jgi:hypothetical protein
MSAGVVKLVDALDSKSSGTLYRVGSIPTSGTIKDLYISNPPEIFAVLVSLISSPSAGFFKILF